MDREYVYMILDYRLMNVINDGMKPDYSKLGRIFNLDRRTVKKRYLKLLEGNKESNEVINAKE